MSRRDEQALAAVGNSLREQRDRAEAALVELMHVVAKVERSLYCDHVRCGCAKHTLRKALSQAPVELADRVTARVQSQTFNLAAAAIRARAERDVETDPEAFADGLTRLAVEAEKAAR